VSLKDQIEHDLDAVFLSTNDFAKPHEIEGNTVVCVVDDTFTPVKQGRILGLVEADMIVSAKVADLPPDRAPESILKSSGATVWEWQRSRCGRTAPCRRAHS